MATDRADHTCYELIPDGWGGAKGRDGRGVRERQVLE